MSTNAQRRLIQDLQKIRKNEEQGMIATPHTDTILIWDAYIQGPVDTIWQAGTFRLQIKITEEYPLVPPNVIFVSKMFHPNIYTDGKICLDILHDKWSPIYDISAILTSLRSLLSDPNPDSPANQQAAQLFINDKQQYEKRVAQVVELSWASRLSLQSFEQKN